MFLNIPESVTLVLASVTKSYVIEGSHVIDCQSYGVYPFFYEGIPVMTFGGGKSNRFTHRPVAEGELETASDVELSEGAQVLLLQSALRSQRVYCIGCLRHPSLTVKPGSVSLDGDSDRVAEPYVTDWFEQYGKAKIIVSNNGSYIVDLKSSSEPYAQIQLPSAGKLRISRDGSATDGVPLFSQLKNYLTELETYLVALEVRINVALAQQHATQKPASPVAGSAATLSPTSPANSIPSVDDTMKSATINLSSDAETI